MFSKPQREVRGRLHEARGRLQTRRRGLAAVSATLIAALAALPTASALASAGPTLPGGGAGTAKRPALAVRQLLVPAEMLSAGELQKLLAALPLNDLSAGELSHYLAAFEGVSALAELKLGLGLLGKQQLGVAGLEECLRKAIVQLGPSAKLGELANAAALPKQLEQALESKLGDLGLLGLLLGELPVVGGSTGLESAFGSLSLEQLVGSLLSSAKTEELPLKEELLSKLSTLAGGLFGELGSEGKLEGLLGGSELVGGFAPKSVKEVSEELKTTPKAISEELGQTVAELPESATMLTAPLGNGKLVGVAPAVKGLVTGLLGGLAERPEGEGEGEGGKGTGEGKGSGESEGTGEGTGEGGKGSGSGEGKGTGGNSEGKGGQGGPGGVGSGGSTTVVLTIPGAASTSSAPTKQKVGKVSILSHRLRGDVATIVLRTPAAGTATIAGKGIRRVSKQAAKAERLTLRVRLSKAASASLRHRRHRLAVKLTASFHPAGGSASSASVTVVFA